MPNIRRRPPRFNIPWWPSSDVWHSRYDVGHKGELLRSEEECADMYNGGGSVSKQLWMEYSKDRPYVSSAGPEVEAATIIFHDRCNILPDLERWIKEEGYHGGSCSPSFKDLDSALRSIIHILLLLGDEDNDDDDFKWDIFSKLCNNQHVNIVTTYLDKR
eukprot:484579-Ditylum_brightwellii.AAC.1